MSRDGGGENISFSWFHHWSDLWTRKRLRQPNFDNFCVQKFVRIYVFVNECEFSSNAIFILYNSSSLLDGWNTIFSTTTAALCSKKVGNHFFNVHYNARDAEGEKVAKGGDDWEVEAGESGGRIKRVKNKKFNRNGNKLREKNRRW